jgi:NADPH:quinone reductase-like Zn-dependent oxidoreductase
VLGYEAAGVIDKVGPGADARKEGSRVLALTQYGGHSDTVCVPENQAFAIPHGKDFTEAAAIPVNYLTAYHILFRAATIRPGERVLVHMAAGGLGTAALQLCRTVDGVQTFGTASAAKHDAIRKEGCAYPIDYHATDYVKEVRRLTDGEGVDVVLDPLGGADSRKGLKLLRPGGRLVTYGFANLTSGEHRNRARMLRQAASVPLLTPLQLMNANKTVAGVHIGRLVDQMDLLAEELTEVLALWAAGTITPRIDATYPFDQAADAHRRILSHGNTGKIILIP